MTVASRRPRPSSPVLGVQEYASGAWAMTVASRRPRPSPILGVQEYASGGLGPASLGCSVLAPAFGCGR